MSMLTKEQIESVRAELQSLASQYCEDGDFNTLCDMALRSLEPGHAGAREPYPWGSDEEYAAFEQWITALAKAVGASLTEIKGNFRIRKSTVMLEFYRMFAVPPAVAQEPVAWLHRNGRSSMSAAEWSEHETAEWVHVLDEEWRDARPLVFAAHSPAEPAQEQRMEERRTTETAWTSAKINPPRVDAYETALSDMKPTSTFQFWNGTFWGLCSNTADEAKDENGETACPPVFWREVNAQSRNISRPEGE